MPNADSKKTLTGVSRGMLQMGRPTPLEGVQSTAPILEQAFGLADDLIAAGTIETAPEKDRLFAVELPGDYKLAIVRGDGRLSVCAFGRCGHALANSSEQIFLGSSII